jgi:hypothetical protein
MIDSEFPHARTARLAAPDRRPTARAMAPPLPAWSGDAWHDDPRRRAHG